MPARISAAVPGPTFGTPEVVTIDGYAAAWSMRSPIDVGPLATVARSR